MPAQCYITMVSTGAGLETRRFCKGRIQYGVAFIKEPRAGRRGRWLGSLGRMDGEWDETRRKPIHVLDDTSLSLSTGRSRWPDRNPTAAPTNNSRLRSGRTDGGTGMFSPPPREHRPSHQRRRRMSHGVDRRHRNARDISQAATASLPPAFFFLLFSFLFCGWIIVLVCCSRYTTRQHGN